MGGQQFGARFLDQAHRVLGDAVLREEGVIGPCQHVYDGVTNTHYIEFCAAHVCCIPGCPPLLRALPERARGHKARRRLEARP